MRHAAENKIRHLIAEIDAYLSSLGAHGVADVRAGINTWKNGPFTLPQPRANPHVGALSIALDLVRADGFDALANAIEEASAHLKWITYDLYPPAQIGEAFAQSHSFCSIIGEGSAINATGFDLGLFIIKPNTLYRDHKHKAPELYAPLTGPHGWRFAKGDALTWKSAHHPVWNEPYQHHATKTGPNPFLCIFGWTRDTHEAASVIVCDDWAKLERETPETVSK